MNGPKYVIGDVVILKWVATNRSFISYAIIMGYDFSKSDPNYIVKEIFFESGEGQTPLILLVDYPVPFTDKSLQVIK